MLRKYFGKTLKFQNKRLEKKYKENLPKQDTLDYIFQRLNSFKNWKIFYDFIIRETKIKKSELILDAGCSMGIYEILFEKEGISTENFIAVDLSNKSIGTINRFKNKFNVKAKFCTMDIEHLALNDNTLDKIFCFNTLHHFPEKSLEKVVQEFHRVLKRGGSVLVLDANLLNILILKSHLTDYWSGNEFPYTPFKLKNIFMKVFKQVKVKTFRFLPKKDKSHIFNKIPILKYFGKEIVIIAEKV